jgi:thiamine biosynthesis lipoprotein
VVAVADPRNPAENAPPLCRIRVRNEAVATSGDYARSTVVRGERRSHILDPRTGRHAVGVAGSTVIAPDAATADAVATILGVLAPADGVAFVDARPGIECLVVASDGSALPSKGWAERVLPDAEEAAAEPVQAWPAQWVFAVEFEVANPAASGGGRGGRRGGRGGARRPYVAVWIEDAEGNPVRTLCLWIEQERWLRDLRRWSRLNGRQRNLIDAVSRATRRPGSYSLDWDGKDDEGAAVPPGEYVVLIEAVREHGTYQLMRQPISIDGNSLDHKLDGNVEIASARVRFGAPQESSR